LHPLQSVPNCGGYREQGAKNGETPTTGDAAASELCCCVCPYVGRTRKDLIYHRQFHRARPTAPFRCAACPFWVAEKRLLAQHQKVHQAAIEGQSSRENAGQGSDGNGSITRSLIVEVRRNVRRILVRGSMPLCRLMRRKF